MEEAKKPYPRFAVGDTVKVTNPIDPLKGRVGEVREAWPHPREHSWAYMYTVHVRGQGDLVYAETELGG